MPRGAEEDALMLAALMQWQHEWPDAAMMIAAADDGNGQRAPLAIELRLSHPSAAALIAIALALIDAAIADIKSQPSGDEALLRRLRDARARLGEANAGPPAGSKGKRGRR